VSHNVQILNSYEILHVISKSYFELRDSKSCAKANADGFWNVF